MKWRVEFRSVALLGIIIILAAVRSPAIESFDLRATIEPVFQQESQVQSSVNETSAYGPPTAESYCWGWAGNLSYTYWDVDEDQGIPGANVTCYLGVPRPECFDLGNGSYSVELNTTYLSAREHMYTLLVAFDKLGYENQVVATTIFVEQVSTVLVVLSPEENQNDEDPCQLVVPLGDSMNLLFYYNDTDDSDGFVGGLEGAHAYASIVGPTLVQRYIELSELGDGLYNLTFDTTKEWLYESADGIPTSHELPYRIYVEFTLENRVSRELLIMVTIIDIPTELVISPPLDNTVLRGGQHYVSVSLMDLWPTHDGLLVQNLNITIESSDPTLLEVVSVTKDSPELGVYTITLHNKGSFFESHAYVNLTITVEKEGYEGKSQVFSLVVLPEPGPEPVPRWLVPSLITLACFSALVLRNRRRMSSAAVPAGNDQGFTAGPST